MGCDRRSNAARRAPRQKTVLEANAAALCLDQVALAEILQDEVDCLPGQSDEVRDVSLAEPERDDDPISVLHAVLRWFDQDGAGWISTALTAAPMSATFGSRITNIGICSTSDRIGPFVDKASRKQADRRAGTIWDPIPPPM